jgi:hypothetical protein
LKDVVDDGGGLGLLAPDEEILLSRSGKSFPGALKVDVNTLWVRGYLFQDLSGRVDRFPTDDTFCPRLFASVLLLLT